MANLLDIRNIATLTKAEASIAEYGVDYSNGDTSILVKFDIVVDANGLIDYGIGATEILGYQFDLDINPAEVGAFDFSLISGVLFGFNGANSAYSGITFNSETGAVALASSTAIVDTDATNDGPPAFLGAEKLVATFYVSPIDQTLSGADVISITIKDQLIVTEAGNIEPSLLTLPEVANTAPVAVDDSASATEDAGSISIDVLSNDIDTEGDSSIISATAANGTVDINTDGTLTYTANSNFNGDDTITYVIADGTFTDTGEVTVTVAAVNDQTTVANSTAVVDEDSAINIDLAANATDIDGDALTITSESALNGTVVDGVYTPDANFNGTDTITYTVNDSAAATVTVTVNSINDATTVTNSTAIVDEDGTVLIDLTANATDIDGDALVLTSASAANGTIANGVYSPDADFNGVDTITYTVNDSATASVTVIVNPVNDATVANDFTATTDEDTSASINFTANATDIDGDALVLTSASAANGTIVEGVYTPDADFNGTDTITYTVNDSAAATGTITVNAINDSPVANDDTAATDEDIVTNIAVLANDVDVDGDSITITAVTALHGTVSVNADGTVAYTPKADFNGADTITYTVNDGDTATVTVNVAAINDAPVANSDATTADESKAATIDVLGNDTDTEGDALTVTAATAGFGTVTINADNSLSYQGGADYDGADTITYTIDDGNGGTATGTVQVSSDSVITVDNSSIVSSNTVPDYTGTSEVNLVKFDVFVDASVLAKYDNITGVNFNISTDQLVYVDWSDSIAVFDMFNTADGNYFQFGSDIVADSDLTTSTPEKVKVATFYADPITDASEISITLSNIEISMDSTTESLGNVVATLATNIAPEFDATSVTSGDIVEDTSTVTGTVSVSDINSNDIAYSGNSAGVYGSFSVNSVTGTWTYTLDNSLTSVQALALGDTVSETFEILADDGFGGTDTLGVSVTVIGTNDNPIAINDSAVTDEDLSVTINILGNDTDIDSATLTITSASAGNGTVVVNNDGTVTYTGNQDFNGTDTISYTIADDVGAESSATVSINVAAINDAPVAVVDFSSTSEEGVVIVDVLANDIDLDGDNLAVVTANATTGTVTINADNTVTYVPNTDFNGVDTIFYTVTDGEYFSSSTVSINVTAVNDTPEAIADTAATDEDTAVLIDVLGNDSDLDGDTLNVASASAVNGTVTVNPDNTLTYIGNQDFNGTDTITYTITDGELTDTSTVTVEVAAVNDTPEASDSTAATDEDTLVVIDVLANDTDLDGDALTVTSASAGNGAVTINADNTVSYIGNQDFNGIDILTYTIADGDGLESTAQVAVTVTPTNDAPYAVNDAATAPEEELINIDVLANDSDLDGDTLSVISATALNGAVIIESDNTISYISNVDFNGIDTVTYTISDGNGGTATAEVTVGVNLVNDAPVAVNDAAVTHEDTSVTINVLDNDSDVDGDSLSVVSATALNGTVTINDDGTLEYLGDPDFNGTDTITYTITDGNGTEATATVTVVTAETNDDPFANADTATTNEDTAVTIDVLANDTDTDGDTLTVTSASATNGTVTINADNTIEYIANQDFNGTDTITYAISDGVLNMAFDGGLFQMFDPTGANIGGSDDLAGTMAINLATGQGTASFSSDQLFFGQDWYAHDITLVMTGADTMTVDMLFDWGTNTNIAVKVDVSVVFNADGTASFTTLDTDGDGILGFPMDNGPFVGFSAAFSGDADSVSLEQAISTVTVDVVAVNDAPVANDDTAATNEDTTVNITVLTNDYDVDGDFITWYGVSQ